MKQVYAVAAAAVLMASVGTVTSAQADDCVPGNPTICKPSAPPTAAAPQQVAERKATRGPLQLHPKKAAPAHRAASRTSTRHHRSTARSKPKHDTETAAAPAMPAPASAPTPAPAQESVTASRPLPANFPIQPKVVPTVAVAAPPVAIPPGGQVTSTFATSQTPWSRVSAFAAPEQPMDAGSPQTWAATLPSEAKGQAKIVPSNVVNEIDLAADKAHAAPAGQPARVADATPSPTTGAAPAAQSDDAASDESWAGWIYRICAHGVSAAASAVRAVLM
jgi:hypothetical protein